MATKKSFFNVIEDSGNNSVYSNGAWERTLLFRKDNIQFKISIRCESYEFQSYARLYKWTEQKGFECVIGKQPQCDYHINCAYRNENEMPKGIYDPIVKDLMEIAEKTFF